jgi:hypothetical protein
MGHPVVAEVRAREGSGGKARGMRGEDPLGFDAREGKGREWKRGRGG